MYLFGKHKGLTQSWFLLVLGMLCGCCVSVQAAGGIPILVITNTPNPLSQYYAEILSTEGLNEFALEDVSAVSNALLAEYDVVILGQAALTTSQVTTLSNWVTAGGKLIAMRPDTQLAGLLGLTDAGSTLSEGYLLVNTTSGPGVGIVGQTMQFHGTADRYTLGSASSLAILYTNAVTATANPAVTLRSVGSNGGQAAAFAFDLAQSIVLMRQGNPAWAEQDRDGIPPVRSNDLFYGAATNDMQPDWIDFNKVAIPQADEQQRFLVNLILSMNSDRKPMPRFWYFPQGHKAVVVMTGDNHGYSGVAGRFDQYLAYSPTNGSVDDWETIRGTAYIFTNQFLTDLQAAAYDAAGFEIALHLDTGCADYTSTSLETMLTDQLGQFTNTYPSLPPIRTQRTHCIAWSGYTMLPEGELLHGIRLDLSYYYWPSNWVLDRPGLFTGSAMPMRFAKTNGSMIDVYQAATQMTDESSQSYPFTVNTLLDRALGPEGYYGAFVANMHMDSVNSAGSDAIVNSAITRGVPVISARQLLTWLDARNQSRFGSVAWSNTTLSFTVVANSSARGLQAMVPIPVGYSISTITSNGNSTAYCLRGIKGMQYAFFPALSGNYEVILAVDTTAPTVIGFAPTNGQAGVSRNTGVTVTFSEAMNASSISTNTMLLRDQLNNAVSATMSYNPSTFAALLMPNSPLGSLETYTVTVKGSAEGVTDLSSNSLASDFVWYFTTADGVLYSIWDNAATPAVLSQDDSNAIELGLKFRSATNGYVTGIRFYKGPGNTGTHVGNFWSSTGTLLASVAFTNETASGWQFQALPSPVPIDSDTTYVVSYHAPVGRYSADSAYFSGRGVTNLPLRALANGEDGDNGVFAYSTTSVFPANSFGAANYWVDLTFHAGVLSLAISTSSLPDSPLHQTYSATLAANGGNEPYVWSIMSGSLPPGLTLNTNSGAVTGTPTATGTFNFTAQVSDSGDPAQSATKPLSITVTSISSVATIWPITAAPTLADGGPDTGVELGVKFRSDITGTIAGIRFYKASANTGTHIGNLWTTNGTLLGSATFTGETDSGWQQANFVTPVTISADTVYVASYHANNGHYSIDLNYFSTNGVDNPPLRALADGISGSNGVFSYGASSTFPTNSFLSANYWVDVVLTFNIAPLATNMVVVTSEDTATNLVLLGGDAEGPVVFAVSANPTHGSLSNFQTNTGALTYTPNLNYDGPDTFSFTVSDGSLMATGQVSITVTAVNDAPVLTAQTNRTVAELTLLTVTNGASDGDIPANTLSYQLISPPAGAVIDTNGVISWTPTEGQGPGTNTITTVVTDNGVPPLSVTNSFEVIVTEVNSAPVLTAQTNRTIGELTLLTVTNKATDGDIPANTLSYQLISPPAGAVIDTNGVISWTPTEGQGPGTNTITTVVTDNGVPPLSVTNSFEVIVTEVNSAPVLTAQTNRTVAELTLLTVTNGATESDIPANTLSYQLISPPAGAVIDTNGVITWTPTEAQGPGTNTITTVVTDNGVPPLSVTNSFEVIVTEVNSAPVLTAQTNRTVAELTLLTVTNGASDGDLPANTLTYQLINPPAGAVIDTNGVITWTPTEGQGPGTNTIRTVVTDNGVPPLSATNSFEVIVTEGEQRAGADGPDQPDDCRADTPDGDQHGHGQ